MQIDLSGRTALVTGSTPSIGSAVAAGLVGAGARVGVSGRSPGSVGRAVAGLRERWPDADLVEVVADVAAEEVTGRALALLPVVDDLAVLGVPPAPEIHDDAWRRYFEVDVLTAVRVTQALLPGTTGHGWVAC